MNNTNPFLISGYISPKYFCDREKETGKIISAIKNGRHLTLLSFRRLGKTGLIKNVFYKLKNEKRIRTLYIDIFQTNNLSDFIKVFGNAILKDEQRNVNFLTKIQNFIISLRAKLVFDELTGLPKVEIDYKDDNEANRSLEKIFEYLASQHEQYVIAFDEFQQITNYPEKNIEAVLRTHIQHQNKDNYIFSGSDKHMLVSMFGDYGRPFYQMSDTLNLGRLPLTKYINFIKKHFKQHNREINTNDIKQYIVFLDNHTFYVQYFFNRLFEMQLKKYESKDFIINMQNILDEKEYNYYSYRNLLTEYQFQIVKSIAKEGAVSSPNSKAFISKYDLGQSSSVNRALKSLMEKEMIYKENNSYKVYDVFFSKWLERI